MDGFLSLCVCGVPLHLRVLGVRSCSSAFWVHSSWPLMGHCMDPLGTSASGQWQMLLGFSWATRGLLPGPWRWLDREVKPCLLRAWCGNRRRNSDSQRAEVPRVPARTIIDMLFYITDCILCAVAMESWIYMDMNIEPLFRMCSVGWLTAAHLLAFAGRLNSTVHVGGGGGVSAMCTCCHVNSQSASEMRAWMVGIRRVRSYECGIFIPSILMIVCGVWHGHRCGGPR